MCHHAHVHVTLSAEDKKDVRKLAGIMIPVYASVVLAVIAVLAVTGAPRQAEQVAAAAVPAAAR
jgi:hypothetical protein